MEEKNKNVAVIKQLDMLAKLLDSQFRIPGTEIRFGMDAIIGLIPGVGDLGTFAVSGYMLIIMSQNGASGFVMARMVVNILIDMLFGMIPILGDLFDVAFKANIRNMRLMKEHYVEGRHRGSAWLVIIPVLLVLLLFIAGIFWLIYKFFEWLF